MMGIADRQTSFSDYWLEGRIPSTSVWSMLRTWALKHLDEKIFEELFSNVGRPSVSPVFTFMAMLIQLEKGMYIIDIKLSSGNVIQKTFIVR